MLQLENDEVRARINPLGAELCSVYSKKFRLEYLWQAGSAWPKHAPVLFPIVGQLKENRFFYNNSWYNLSRHGFARERHFSVDETGPNRLLFRLHDDEQSRSVFPFHFQFEVDYHLRGSELDITYSVLNTGSQEGWYSFGAHPAFRVPLDIRDRYEDYYIEFSEVESSKLWPLTNGLIAAEAKDFFTSKEIPLSKTLFAQDALVFKSIRSSHVDLRSRNHQHGVKVLLNQCPYLGIWAAPGADFVCIEPWQGIADSVNSDGFLVNKEGMIRLEPGAFFRYDWGISLF
jgi:galactose mutarotase-like enzyme